MSSEPELIIERVFEAPRELVWQAWTEPKRMVSWMGPPKHPATHMEGEIKPGGKWRGCLRSGASGEDLWQGGEYLEIDEPERLVFTFYWEGDDGKPEKVMLITLTFQELDGRKTRMTMHQAQFSSEEQRDGHRIGWNGAFDRLDKFLAVS